MTTIDVLPLRCLDAVLHLETRPAAVLTSGTPSVLKTRKTAGHSHEKPPRHLNVNDHFSHLYEAHDDNWTAGIEQYTVSITGKRVNLVFMSLSMVEPLFWQIEQRISQTMERRINEI